MTPEQAESILNGLCAPFTKRLNDDERPIWLAAFRDLDAQQAAAVAISYGKQGERFPSLPEFRKAVRGHSERENRKPEDAKPRSKPPAWIFRWVAARFLHARFGRAQDMRRFPEQGDWADPDQPLMSPEEWLEEARMISDAEVWAAVTQFGTILPDGPPPDARDREVVNELLGKT